MGAVPAAAGAASPTLSLEHADDAAYDEEKGDGEDEDDDEGLHTADCFYCRRIGRILRIYYGGLLVGEFCELCELFLGVGLSANWADYILIRIIRKIRRRKEERIRRQRSREPSWKTSVETTQARPMV